MPCELLWLKTCWVRGKREKKIVLLVKKTKWDNGNLYFDAWFRFVFYYVGNLLTDCIILYRLRSCCFLKGSWPSYCLIDEHWTVLIFFMASSSSSNRWRFQQVNFVKQIVITQLPVGKQNLFFRCCDKCQFGYISDSIVSFTSQPAIIILKKESKK